MQSDLKKAASTPNTMQMAMALSQMQSYRPAGALQISELFGLSQAASILGDMAAVYFVSVAGILAAFFGAQAWSNRKP